MLKALKTFGIGLLYILISPLIAAGSVLCVAFGLGYALFYTFTIVSRFFRGKKLFPPFEEDVAGTENIDRAYAVKEEPKEEPKPSNVYVQQNYYQAMPGANPFNNGQLPPNYAQGQLPPNYAQGQLPPNYTQGQLPPNYAPGQLPPNYGQNPYGTAIPPQANPYMNPNPQIPNGNPTPEAPKITQVDEDGNPLDEDGLPILIKKEDK